MFAHIQQVVLDTLYSIPVHYTLSLQTNEFKKVHLKKFFCFLKGTVSRDFCHFFNKIKKSNWAQYEQAKRFCEIFRFREDIRKYSLKTCVRVVVDYAVTMSVWSLTSLTHIC